MIIDKAMQYCRDALRNVSRSFALTIPMLEKNILIPILVGYLEARILDSFEDEKKCEIGNKKRVENMEKVISIISDPDSLDKGMIKELGDAASELMQNPHYLDLTLNMDKVMAVHRTIDRNSSNAISRWFSIMSAGMQKYLNKRIDTFEQLDEYCYYVGGTIGGFLTEVLLDKTRMASTEQVRILKAEQRDFGLFLQKVNIIRDFREDMLRNEKIFWPHEVFMEHNLKPSMSWRGNCYDNAVAESFFSSLKKERIRRKIYAKRAEARADIFDYIEVFYNRTRRHSHLGQVSPAVYEADSRGS